MKTAGSKNSLGNPNPPVISGTRNSTGGCTVFLTLSHQVTQEAEEINHSMNVQIYSSSSTLSYKSITMFYSTCETRHFKNNVKNIK